MGISFYRGDGGERVKGGTTGGHYVSMSLFEDQWFFMDDEVVTQVNISKYLLYLLYPIINYYNYALLF